MSAAKWRIAKQPHYIIFHSLTYWILLVLNVDCLIDVGATDTNCVRNTPFGLDRQTEKNTQKRGEEKTQEHQLTGLM
jgi:hypothetical protein